MSGSEGPLCLSAICQQQCPMVESRVSSAQPAVLCCFVGCAIGTSYRLPLPQPPPPSPIPRPSRAKNKSPDLRGC